MLLCGWAVAEVHIWLYTRIAALACQRLTEFVPLSTIMALIVWPLLSAGWLDHGAKLLLDSRIAVHFGQFFDSESDWNAANWQLQQSKKTRFKIYFFIWINNNKIIFKCFKYGRKCAYINWFDIGGIGVYKSQSSNTEKAYSTLKVMLFSKVHQIIWILHYYAIIKARPGPRRVAPPGESVFWYQKSAEIVGHNLKN